MMTVLGWILQERFKDNRKLVSTIKKIGGIYKIKGLPQMRAQLFYFQ